MINIKAAKYRGFKNFICALLGQVFLVFEVVPNPLNIVVIL